MLLLSIGPLPPPLPRPNKDKPSPTNLRGIWGLIDIGGGRRRRRRTRRRGTNKNKGRGYSFGSGHHFPPFDLPNGCVDWRFCFIASFLSVLATEEEHGAVFSHRPSLPAARGVSERNHEAWQKSKRRFGLSAEGEERGEGRMNEIQERRCQVGGCTRKEPSGRASQKLGNMFHCCFKNKSTTLLIDSTCTLSAKEAQITET